MKKMNFRTIGGILFMLTTVAITIGALYVMFANTIFWISSESAIGEVSGFEAMQETSRVYKTGERYSDRYQTWNTVSANAIMVSFNTATGEEISFVTDFGSSADIYSQGDQVTVLYDPKNPENAKIKSFKSLYLGPLLLLIMGLVFSFMCIILFIAL